MIAVLWLGGCAGGAATVVGSAAAAPTFTAGAAVTIVCAHAHAAGCEVVETASDLGALQAALVPELAASLPACDFMVERLVVAWLHGAGVAPPVSVSVHSEEGVDVVVLSPTSDGGPERTLLHAFVVPLRPAQLAVVARIGAGPGHETTLAVFPGR
ncbi:MAG: hypothetical protein WBO45_11980 [Planctomycetota bacterium]